MKKIYKRVIAVLCAVALVAGTILTGNGSVAKADDTHESVIFDSASEQLVNASGTDIYYTKTFSTEAPTGVDEYRNLALCMSVTVADEATLGVMKTGVVELTQSGKQDQAEFEWKLSGYDLQVGTNELCLLFADATYLVGTEGVKVDLAKPFNFLRIWESSSATPTSATLTSLKIVDLTEAGITFGDSDDYLQLKSALSDTPETVEASVKMESTPTEWIVAGTETILNGSATYGVTKAGDAPGEGVSYAEATVGTGLQYIINEKLGKGIVIEAPDFGPYQMGDLALTFWYYSDRDGTLPGGEIELGSLPAEVDNGEISRWTGNISVTTGWNYIQLPLSQFNEVATGDNPVNFDYNNIVRVRWYSNASETYGGFTFKVTDFKIEVVEADAPVTEWTVVGTDQIMGSKTGYTKSETSAGEAPGEGVSYVEATVNGTAIITGSGNGVVIEAPDFGTYAKDKLALTFWYYSDTTGTLSSGEIELASNSTGTEIDEAVWRTGNIYVKQGWNHIQLPLSQFTSSTYNYTNTVRVRWYFDSVTDYHFKLTDLKIEVMEDTTPEAEWTIATATICNGSTEATTHMNNGPDDSWNVAEVTTNGTQQHFKKTDLTTPNFGNYTLDDLSLAFWYYSYETTTTTLPAGQIELSCNSSSNDAYEIYWESAEISVEYGWNYIELPLAAYRGMGGSGFNLSQLCFVRWYRNSYDTEWKFKLSDIKIVVNEAAKYDENWVLWNNDGARGLFNQSVAKTTETSYVNILYKQLSDAINASKYTKSELAVAFWYYSHVDGTLPSGEVELTSSGGSDRNELHWQTAEISVEQGWNYIVLPLDTGIGNGETYGDIALDGVNYVRLYINKKSIATDTWKYSIADMRLIVTDTSANEANSIVVNENIDAAMLDGYMVFSNLCEAEENAYALFITRDGYPSFLWGTTQYTLQTQVKTGDWVDLAVTCDTTNGTLSFYIDGKLAQTMQTTFTELGKFKTAHCIGANGDGLRMMKGTIADVRVWSDVRTADEIADNLVEKQYNTTNGKLTTSTEGLIGGWFLYGDKQDVLVQMEDVKGVNPAVFRGTRADDWYDYATKEHSFLYDKSGNANYWSLVFIPDIQNLTTGKGGCEEVWMNMAHWIAENVESENIKHVIGAGDTTWNDTDAQYTMAMNGIKLFDDQVPFTNLIGNHDYEWSATYRNSSQYQKYFGTAYNEDASNAISSVEKGYFSDTRADDSTSQNTVTTTENAYYRFTVGKTSWMILQLEYHPRMSVIKWADSILKQYPNDNVILATHSYIDGKGAYNGEWMTYLNNEITADGSDYNATTEAIWTELKDNSNIKMILCGHSTNDTGAIAVREETNEEGRTVKALMINAQDLDANETATSDTEYYSDRPLGMLSILRFSEDGSQVAVQYYSPTDDKSFNPLDSETSTTRSTKDLTLAYGVQPYIQAYAGAKATVAPTENVPEGYVFGGWFTDENCTTPLTGETSETVYAKFVHEDMLTVKAQVKLDENNALPTEKTDIRFVTTVDSLDYKEIGFEITINNVTRKVGIDDEGNCYVYKKLYAVGVGATATEETKFLTYTPYDNFDLQANYFKTYTIRNISAANYGLDITVTPYWITRDGTTVKGQEVTKNVNGTLSVITQ